MAARQYFYTDDNGIVQRYEYCVLCSAGPFTQGDLGTKYKSAGGGRHVTYCMSCARTLGLKDLPPPVKMRMSETFVPPELAEIPAQVQKPTVVKPKDPVVSTVVKASAIVVKIETKSVEKPIEKPIEKKIEPVDTLVEDRKPVPEKAAVSDTEHLRYLGILQAELSGKKPIPVKGPYSIYIAQSVDGSYTCGVTTNLEVENKRLNSDKQRTGFLPIEIVCYRTEKKKDDALYMRGILSKYRREQKERLIQTFERQFFAVQGSSKNKI